MQASIIVDALHDVLEAIKIGRLQRLPGRIAGEIGDLPEHADQLDGLCTCPCIGFIDAQSDLFIGRTVAESRNLYSGLFQLPSVQCRQLTGQANQE
ncbi:hypothetical protein C7E12_00540 [Stenotrophomonas maltophilia]|nr:hypothetical protein C7E14_02215 [Stenotrophomonas maltophilia]PSD32164.1 hypothetical protein C7E12_00540 [Stenotrophomonas maltophilia]